MEISHQSLLADRYDYLKEKLQEPCSPPALFLAEALREKFPGAAILLYGSAGSVMSDAPATDVLFDFYVVAPSYKAAYRSPILRWANAMLPPNVFYLTRPSPEGMLRAKYAVISLRAFKRRLSARAFHSYFWGRFAQPFKVVSGTADEVNAMARLAANAIDVFVERSAPLAHLDGMTAEDAIKAIWRAGLSASYRAELRAEKPGRAAELLASYGDWPQHVTILDQHKTSRPDDRLRWRARQGWRVRSALGGVLSILRLLKATFTFRGGVDYIVWKIQRHAGVVVPVKNWERRYPFLAAPLLAARYYRLRRQDRRRANTG
ncbi:MAG: hypothetical protein AAGD92_13045 [Pseudomonadota bacterium]